MRRYVRRLNKDVSSGADGSLLNAKDLMHDSDTLSEASSQYSNLVKTSDKKSKLSSYSSTNMTSQLIHNNENNNSNNSNSASIVTNVTTTDAITITNSTSNGNIFITNNKRSRSSSIEDASITIPIVSTTNKRIKTYKKMKQSEKHNKIYVDLLRKYFDAAKDVARDILHTHNNSNNYSSNNGEHLNDDTYESTNDYVLCYEKLSTYSHSDGDDNDSNNDVTSTHTHTVISPSHISAFKYVEKNPYFKRKLNEKLHTSSDGIMFSISDIEQYNTQLISLTKPTYITTTAAVEASVASSVDDRVSEMASKVIGNKKINRKKSKKGQVIADVLNTFTAFDDFLLYNQDAYTTDESKASTIDKKSKKKVNKQNKKQLEASTLVIEKSVDISTGDHCLSDSCGSLLYDNNDDMDLLQHTSVDNDCFIVPLPKLMMSDSNKKRDSIASFHSLDSPFELDKDGFSFSPSFIQGEYPSRPASVSLDLSGDNMGDFPYSVSSPACFM